VTEAGAVLVVAKAPVAGQAKTRLAEQVGSVAAADLAAAALLDVLAAATLSGARLVVALTGDLTAAARREVVTAALAAADVFPQRGDAFADRLASAHADARALIGTGPAILQVGMDTPQLTPALLRASLRTAATSDAVLGPAEDGGWWALAVREPAWAEALRTVAMSRPDTGERTLAALQAVGADVAMLPIVRDVDTWADARAVATLAPGAEFAAAVAAVVRRSRDQP
jgi:glycosyltransferase A (GT-A) superfamily protein (DUF2064 family)